MASKEDIQVKIEADESSARVILASTTAPASVTVATLSAIATAAGVKLNAKVQERLKAIAEQFIANPAALDEVFATAQAPVNGIDGTLAWEDQFDPNATEQETIKRADTDEKIDFYAGSHFIHVTIGAQVATLQQPTDGADGASVTGKLLKAKPGRPCPLQVGPGLSLVDQQKVVATEEGVLLVKDGVVSVSKVLEIAGFVDFETGNIDFDGDVVIRQGVRDLFVVKASGNIQVGGLVESAKIDCGGNFTCHRGVCARGNGDLAVKGNADIGFMDNAHGKILGTLKVHREIINCDLVVNGDLQCEAGTMIGGTIVAGANVHIRTLGSEGECLTLLEVGAMPILTDKLRSLETQLNKVAAQIKTKQELLAQVQQQGKNASAQAREQLTELAFELDQLQHKAATAELQRAELLTALAQSPKVKVRVDSVVYPSVRLLAGPHQIIFDRPVKGPIIFGFDERKNVTFQVSGGTIRPITDIARVGRRPPTKPKAQPPAKPLAA